MNVNERVKELRTSLGLTLEKFGEKLGVGKNAISRIETGKSNLTDQMIKAICNVNWNGKYVNENWLRNGGSNENMFIKLNKDEELAMYTQMLLDSTDDVVADMIKEIIIMYEKLDNDSKQVLKNFTKDLLNKIKNT